MVDTTESGKIVRCPACGGNSEYVAGNPYRPFCCERCKLQDLGQWASESFRVPTQPSFIDSLAGDSTLQ